jgi:prepilin-type N-terminal cleavage/methylation domain-containing protein
MKTSRKKVGLGGFTLVEIMIVIAIIGLLCAIAIPNYVRARANAQASACINNLRELSNAADQFALEHGKTTGDQFSYPDDITPYITANLG